MNIYKIYLTLCMNHAYSPWFNGIILDHVTTTAFSLAYVKLLCDWTAHMHVEGKCTLNRTMNTVSGILMATSLPWLPVLYSTPPEVHRREALIRVQQVKPAASLPICQDLPHGMMAYWGLVGGMNHIRKERTWLSSFRKGLSNPIVTGKVNN